MYIVFIDIYILSELSINIEFILKECVIKITSLFLADFRKFLPPGRKSLMIADNISLKQVICKNQRFNLR